MKFFMRVAFFSSSFLLILALFGTLGCQDGNTNSVDCFESDCEASCITKGRTGGHCVDEDICECDALGEFPGWEDPQNDTETEDGGTMDAGDDAEDTDSADAGDTDGADAGDQP